MNPEPHEQRLEWKVGEDVHPDDPLPTDIENGMNAIHGCAPGDWSHRLYLMPIGTPLEDIIEFFEVGYPAALRHGWEEREVTDLIVETLNAINNIVPGSVEMAAPSGLRFRFWRCLRDDELEEIEAIYGKADEYKAGLERYINHGLSGSSLLQDVGESGLLHLAWH